MLANPRFTPHPPPPGILTRVSFALSLATDVVEAEAGATTPVGLTVVNRGDATDRFEVDFEGIDPEWGFVPVPVFPVEGGESRSEKLFLKPPRLPESVAGSYPFVVRVRSLESGETRTAQALLHLLPFHQVTMEIAPKKGVVSPTTKRNDFRLTLVNLGNSEHTMQLSAQDPEERCAYEFDQAQVTLAPGQGKEVEVVANPKQTPILSSSRLIGFSVFARSQNERTVTATAQAQLEQRPLLSPGALILGFVLIAGTIGWWSVRPKPPTVQLFLNPPHALAGTPVEVRYEARNADHVLIKMGDETVYDGPPTDAPVTVTLAGEGDATFTATATREGRDPNQDVEHLKIDVPAVVPEAEILGFKTAASRIKVGTSFIVKWKVKNATKVAITPSSTSELSPDLEQYELTAPATPGEQVYTLIAYNAEGKTAKLTLKVTFYDESDAAILAFAASPESVKEEDGGRTTLSWQATGAERVELVVGSAAAEAVDPTGSREIALTAKTKCVLTAIDAKGRKVARGLWIGFEKKPIVIDPTPDPAGAPPDPNYPDKIPPP